MPPPPTTTHTLYYVCAGSDDQEANQTALKYVEEAVRLGFLSKEFDVVVDSWTPPPRMFLNPREVLGLRSIILNGVVKYLEAHVKSRATPEELAELNAHIRIVEKAIGVAERTTEVLVIKVNKAPKTLKLASASA